MASLIYSSSSNEVANPLVRMYAKGGEILIHPEELGSEKVLNVKTNLTNPNVIFILLESVSDNRLSNYGYLRKTTPNIDKLAEKGIVFRNAYTTSTHSDYAQPTYLSSRYVLENNFKTSYLDNPNRTFVWEIFSDKNYTTGYISSQDDSWAGMDNYFEFDSLDFRSYSLTDGVGDYKDGPAKKDYDHNTMNVVFEWLNESFVNCTNYEKKVMNLAEYLLNVSNETEGDNLEVDLDLNLITITNYSNCLAYDFNEENPFFLYVNLQGTHNPLTYHSNYSYYTPDEAGKFGKDNYDNRYDNALRYVDAQIGRLLDYLKSQNLEDNTIIILSSDHGHDTRNEHGINGHGTTVYDDELKVPLIFYFPDLAPLEVNERVSHIDVLPTVMDILGYGRNENFQGSPMLKDDRLIFYIQSHKNLVGAIKNDIKIIIDMNRNLAEAYNLKKDPDEKNNILDYGKYDKNLLETLLWHNCQLNYFSVDDKPERLKDYCEAF